jgi:hypothetical protein
VLPACRLRLAAAGNAPVLPTPLIAAGCCSDDAICGGSGGGGGGGASVLAVSTLRFLAPSAAVAKRFSRSLMVALCASLLPSSVLICSALSSAATVSCAIVCRLYKVRR